jgi:hypothetical protein
VNYLGTHQKTLEPVDEKIWKLLKKIILSVEILGNLSLFEKICFFCEQKLYAKQSFQKTSISA